MKIVTINHQLIGTKVQFIPPKHPVIYQLQKPVVHHPILKMKANRHLTKKHIFHLFIKLPINYLQLLEQVIYLPSTKGDQHHLLTKKRLILLSLKLQLYQQSQEQVVNLLLIQVQLKKQLVDIKMIHQF